MSSANDQVRDVAARVLGDHTKIRALLDDVEGACAAATARPSGGLDGFRRAVWDMYIAFEDHLAMEEAELAPLLVDAVPEGKARGVAMILEHNEQRRILLELVEDTECDAKKAEALIAEARALVSAFRKDMAIEERSFGQLAGAS